MTNINKLMYALVLGSVLFLLVVSAGDPVVDLITPAGVKAGVSPAGIEVMADILKKNSPPPDVKITAEMIDAGWKSIRVQYLEVCPAEDKGKVDLFIKELDVIMRAVHLGS